MIDGYGREIDYLRISVTDRCNLRCGYCMPKDGVENIIHPEILSFEEITRIVRVMARLGIRRVRLTGGEPLVRRGITEFVRMLSNIDGIDEIAMTSNAILLSKMASELKNAGLTGVNISLDTLDNDVFRKITGYDGLDEVLKGIDASLSAGLKVKITCGPLVGENDGELTEIANIARDKPVDVRFIELMPIGCGVGFGGISSDDILKRLENEFGPIEDVDSPITEKVGNLIDGKYDYDEGKGDKISSYENEHIHGPAEYYRFPGFMGRVGFISPMSHKFCGSCNRIRLTSDGFLKLCLQYPAGVDLKAAMRGNCTDEELASIINEAMKNKPLSHSFNNMFDYANKTIAGNNRSSNIEKNIEKRKMVQIGG